MPEVVTKAPIKEFTPLYQDSPTDEDSGTRDEKVCKEATYRYKDLPDERFQVVQSILRGWMPLKDIPHLKARVVRIFVSSTFTDMIHERNTLISKAYPLLRAYCRERYGLEFQAVDMRWGVQSGARDDHSSADLCIEEIHSSQKLSVGPNFVAFIGQKYGYIDLPRQLSHKEFEPIRKVIKEEMTDFDVDFLDQWYRKDTNATPTSYVLQPISTVLGDDTSSWDEVSTKLMSVLMTGLTVAVETEKVSEEVLTKLKSSITEQELQEGVFNMPLKYKDANVLCFIREITDLDNYLDRSKAFRFIDQKPNKIEVDDDKNKSVRRLRNKLKAHLAGTNTREYKVTWKDPEGIDPEFHDSYLDELNRDFFNRVKEMIDYNMANQDNGMSDELYEEVLQQWHTVKTRCKNFMGRTDILEQISNYVLSDTDQALVIHGESGYGKTSIMAKAGSECVSYIQQNGLTVLPYVILRFCGTSPGSSNVRQLLFSISNQLAYVTNKYRHEIPKDFKLLKAYFKDFLQKGNFPGLIVIFIDAVNQLSLEDNSHKLDWLPSKIAKNVKVIVSCITGENDVYQKLRSKITNERYYIEVNEMTPVLCGEILSTCLQERGRIINFMQWRLVREAFNKCSLPLFVKLTFEEVITWKSYLDVHGCVPDDALATSVPTCIQRLFDRLEEKHGKMMVSHALGYITASQGGISEAEMEDVLSLDDQVLNSVFSHWEPPLRRIPPILFPRIKLDITGYLVERECDETTVMYWYHQQFIEAATKRYLSQPDIFDATHNNLADYFLGTWSEMKKKPFLYLQSLAKRIKVKDLSSSAVRYVPKQPLVFNKFSCEQNFRYNYRKLNQMPYHLAKAKRSQDLNKHVYFNFDFLYTKLKACSIQRLISDFSFVKDHEVQLVADALRMSEAALTIDPDVLPVEITGRLLPHYDRYENLHSLIRQCDINCLYKCPVIPNWQVFTTPGGPLQYVCEADASIHSDIDVELIQTEDDTVLLTAKPFHGMRMRVWDITQGEPQPDMVLLSGSRSYSTPNGVYVNLFKGNRSLQTFRVDSGELSGEVNFPYGKIRQVRSHNKYFAFTYDQAAGPVVIDIEAHMLIHRFQYQAKVVALSQDEKYLVTNNVKCLAMHSLPLMERTCVIDIPHVPEKVLFSSDHSRFYTMDMGHELKCVRVNLVHRRAKSTGILRDIEMKDFKLSHSEEMLLVRSSRCLYLFNTDREKVVHKITSMPPGVFVERLSTFKQAGFTPNDELIAAVRHIYLGVWSVKTGEALRLLQSSVSPVLSLYTSDTVNCAITLLQDHSIQVWNLNNLDADVQHLNAIIKGSIKCMSSSTCGNRVICCGKDHSEGRVLNLETNECEWTLEHTDEIGKHLDDVIMSPRGKFAITRMENIDYPDFLEPWELLKEDKLWDLASGEPVQVITNSRHVVFSPKEDKVVFFVCREYSTYDWSIVSYDLIGVGLTGETAFDTFFFALPDGDVVGKPFITECGQYLAFILQSKDDEKSTSSGFTTQLLVYSFEKCWRGLKFITLKDIWSGVGEQDRMLDIQLFNDDNALIVYGYDLASFDHLPNGVYSRSKNVAKGCFVYSFKNDNVIKRMENFAQPTTNIENLILSSQRHFVLDRHNGQLFSTMDNEQVNALDLSTSKVLPKCVCLLMNGRYVAMLSSSRRELLIERAEDGVRKARVFLHGVADHIQGATNDSTIIIGCRDGRILSFTVVVEMADHRLEVNALPSRRSSIKPLPKSEQPMCQFPGILKLEGGDPGIVMNKMDNGDGFAVSGTALTLKSDIRQIKTTQNLQKKLSTITRERIMNQKRKQASFKAVGQAVLLTQEYNRIRNSQSCVVQ